MRINRNKMRQEAHRASSVKRAFMMKDAIAWDLR